MFKRLFSFIAGFRTQLIIAAVIASLSFAGGFHVRTVLYDANKTHATEKQLEKAKKAPAKIIKFQQDLRRTSLEKDDCYNRPVPADVLNLLR